MQLILLLGGVVYVLGMLVLGWAWMSARSRVTAVEDQILQVQAQLNAPELREAVQAVDRFTKDEAEKNQKASVVNTLRKRQATLVRLVDALPDWTMGGQVWVQSLVISTDRNERLVTMSGNATSPMVFAQFFTNLESQPLVKKLKLPGAIRTGGSERGQVLTSFSLNFVLEDYQ
jgi:hypothetical protein